MPELLRAGIIGLGQIGSRFDEDPKRISTWTHAGAYRRVPEVALVAGADPDETARGAFERRWHGVRGYADYRQMLDTEGLDIVSVCVPTPLHAEVAAAAAEAGARAIFCEKPIAATRKEGQAIVEQCRTRRIVLAVNHIRRWDRNYLWARHLVEDGFIGRLVGVMAAYSGGVHIMGTHLFDTIQLFAGRVQWVVGERAGTAESPDPPMNGLLGLPGGVTATVLALTRARDEMFEIDLLGSEGRIRVEDNGRRIETFRFEDNPYAGGYRRLAPIDRPNLLPENERFVMAMQDLVACLHDGRDPACSGEDGLAALAVAEGLCRSAGAGGERVVLGAGC